MQAIFELTGAVKEECGGEEEEEKRRREGEEEKRGREKVKKGPILFGAERSRFTFSSNWAFPLASIPPIYMEIDVISR